MESALRIWTMLFPSQAADRIFSSSSVRLFEHVFALFCPRACTVKDADGGHKACAITARMSGHQQHVPYANIHTGYRSGQGYEEASAREKLVNPSLLNFRGPGVHKNGIVGFSGNRCEGAHERRRLQAYRLAESLSESHPYVVQVCTHC